MRRKKKGVTPLDASVARHPAAPKGSEDKSDFVATVDKQKRAALANVKLWSNRRLAAKLGYDESLAEARRLGLSSTVVAKAAGVSEAAIRMHYARKDKVRGDH